MIRFLSLVILIGVATGCSPPKTGGAATPHVYEAVRGMAGAKQERVELLALADKGAYGETQHFISTNDYSCDRIQSLWLIDFTARADMKMRIVKADCVTGGSYQITQFDGKFFVKPWTGTLIGP